MGGPTNQHTAPELSPWSNFDVTGSWIIPTFALHSHSPTQAYDYWYGYDSSQDVQKQRWWNQNQIQPKRAGVPSIGRYSRWSLTSDYMPEN